MLDVDEGCFATQVIERICCIDYVLSIAPVSVPVSVSVPAPVDDNFFMPRTVYT